MRENYLLRHKRILYIYIYICRLYFVCLCYKCQLIVQINCFCNGSFGCAVAQTDLIRDTRKIPCEHIKTATTKRRAFKQTSRQVKYVRNWTAASSPPSRHPRVFDDETSARGTTIEL